MSETDTTSRFDLSLDVEANEIQTIKVEIKGRIVEFPIIDEWPIEASELLQEGKLLPVLDLLLADRPEDRDAFKGIRVGQLKKLMEHLAALSGATQGEGLSSAL